MTPEAVAQFLKTHRTIEEPPVTLESLVGEIRGVSRQLENIESQTIETNDRLTDLDARIVNLESRVEKSVEALQETLIETVRGLQEDQNNGTIN